VWTARAESRIGAVTAQRRRRALLLSDKRLRIFSIVRSRELTPLVDIPLGAVEIVQVRRARPMVQIRMRIEGHQWIVEFRPRDRSVATATVDAIDTAPVDFDTAPVDVDSGPEPDVLAEPGTFTSPDTSGGTDATPPVMTTMPVPPPGAPAPGATPAPTPMAPGFPAPAFPASAPGFTTPSPPPPETPLTGPISPRPEMLLAVLAMGDPSAVLPLANAVQGGFPPPPDPVPKVDRLSVRNVVNQLLDGRCTAVDAQRWASVVQRAVRLPQPPLMLDPFDPFPDQIMAGIAELAGFTSTTDVAAASQRVIAAIEGRA